ncbi:MAG: tetratricopeptide repeat protein [Candidatus Methylomirabilales bacterium]
MAYSSLAPHSLKWAILGILVPLIALLWLWGGCGRRFRPLPKLAVPLLALLLVSVLSLPQAVNLYYGLQRIAFLLVLFLLYLTVAYTCSQPDRQEKLIRYLLLTLLVVSVFSLYGCTMGCRFPSVSPAVIIFRLFGNTNYGSAYLLTVIPFSLALYLNATRQWERTLWGTTLFLAMALVTLSMVRGAWVSIWIGIWLLVKVSFHRDRSPGILQSSSRLPQVAPLLLLGSAVLVAYALWPLCLPGLPSFGERMSTFLDPGASSLQWRLAVWKGTLRMIRDHFWTGVGVGNFALAFVPYRSAITYQHPTVQPEHAHNEYLNLWAELGPLGLLVFLWLAVRIIRLGWHLAKGPGERRGVLAGVLGGLAASAAYGNLFYVLHTPAAAMNIAILLGMLDGMDRAVGNDERGAPIRLTYLLPGLLVMGLICFQYFLRPLVGETHYVLAQRDFRQERMETGLGRLERSLEWNPQSYKARYRRATAFFLIGRYPEAIQEAQKVLKIHPKLEIAYWIIGSAYRKLGEKPKAKEMYLQALAVNPNYPHALNNLGTLAAEEGRASEAEALFLRAKEVLGRSNISPYTNLGNLYETTGHIQEALRMYETAVAIKPETDSNWYRVARLRVLSGNPEGAYEALARAIALDERWRARAVQDPVFAGFRRSDARVRTLLHVQ